MNTFTENFLRGDYMPHGHCFLWQPGILWTTVISDLLIGAAYFAISGALFLFVKKRNDLKFKGIFFLFSGFILWCGLTHLYSVYTIWHGAYGTQSLIKLMTAIVSVITAIVLIKNFRQILAIPNPKQLENALSTAAEEKAQRDRIEIERKAEEIFKFTTELLPTGLLVVNENKHIVIANKALEDMFGYASNELRGKPVAQLIHFNRAEHHDLLIQQYMDSPTQDHIMAAGRVVEGKTKSGDSVSLEISLSTHTFQGERHAFASVTDVSNTRQAQTSLYETSNRHKRALSAANEGIWEWNVKTGDVWFSPAFMRMIGRTTENEQPKLQYWLDHIHPDDRKQVQEKLGIHSAKNENFDVVYRGVNDSGQYEWMQVRGGSVNDVEANPLLISGTLLNIHDKKMLEIELAEKSHFLNSVLEKSLCGVYIFDLLSRKNTFINDQHTSITGYTLEELNQESEKGWLTFFHADDQEKVDHHIKEVVASRAGEGISVDYRLRHKDGRWIWCYSKDSVYARDEQGRPTAMIGTFFDITDIKKAEDALAQSNASLERFAYSASHDLQEPLRKISAFSDSLELRLAGKLEDDPDAKYELDRISNAASRMREMISSLLELSRLSRKKIKKKSVSLKTLVKQACDDLSSLIQENDARVNVLSDIQIEVDHTTFQQVLRNLITNSIRYAKSEVPPAIDISGILHENACSIDVVDNGIGFSHTQAEKIFEPFHRLVGRSIPGSGMGLAICKQIVAVHGGTMTADSTPDYGARFVIKLPVDQGKT